MARTYALALSGVLAWSAVDVIAAAWAIGRARQSESHQQQSLVLYGANMQALGFHEPSKLREAATDLEAKCPAWDKMPSSAPATSWDAFLSSADAMGAG